MHCQEKHYVLGTYNGVEFLKQYSVFMLSPLLSAIEFSLSKPFHDIFLNDCVRFSRHPNFFLYLVE